MTGTYLSQLHAALLGLHGTLSAAFEAAGLEPLEATVGEPVELTERRPLLVVSLAGSRPMARPFGTLTERVPVNLTLLLDQGESDSLAYEGVLKAGVADLCAALAPLVTDAHLTTLELVGSASGPDDSRENTAAWAVTVQLEALLQLT